MTVLPVCSKNKPQVPFINSSARWDQEATSNSEAERWSWKRTPLFQLLGHSKICWHFGESKHLLLERFTPNVFEKRHRLVEVGWYFPVALEWKSHKNQIQQKSDLSKVGFTFLENARKIKSQNYSATGGRKKSS